MRDIMSFGGIAFCAFAAYQHTHSVVTAAAVAWGMWVLMPDPPRPVTVTDVLRSRRW